MSEIQALSDIEKAFLDPFLPRHNGEDLPFVTLTYAQSLDSMISLAPGLRTTLSGPETKSMTHYLRVHHDAILVGVGTAIPDDPSLNCRYPGVTPQSQPQPVIIDPQGRWQIGESKVLKLAGQGEGKAPWVVHNSAHQASQNETDNRGCRRLWLEADSDRIPWISILRKLKRNGINSVMIEGGASIISTLLAAPELINVVIITIAPTWLGKGGVTVTPEARVEAEHRVNAARLKDTAWHQFGADAVLCGRLQR